MISILNSYNNGGYVESRPRLFQLLNLLISKNFTGHASLIFEQARGAEGRDEQRRGLRTKALTRDLGTRLECRQRVLLELEKHCGSKSIVAQPDSNLPPSGQ